MEQPVNYRHELKFEIPYGEYLVMRSRLKLIMKSDPHAGEDGRYRIRSIYFDNSDDKALREKIDGSDVDIEAMGVFSMGGGGAGGGFGGFGGGGGRGGNDGEDPSEDGQGGQRPSGDFDPNNMPSGFDGGNMPDMGNFDFSNMPGGGNNGGFTPGGNSGNSSDSTDTDTSSRPSFPGSGMSGQSFNMTSIQNGITLAVCFAVAIVALVVLKFINPKG